MAETLKDRSQIDQLASWAFSNRNTTSLFDRISLFVDIPDDDGYAGWTEGIHAIGIVESESTLVVEADFNDQSRRSRLQDVIRLNRDTLEISFERYTDGQAELEGADPEIAVRCLTKYLSEAKHGAKIGTLTDLPPKFFSPELQFEPVEVVDDKKES